MIKALNKPEVKTRYKLYKRKKQWVVSGISTIAATGLMFTFQTGIAHADTVNTNNGIGDTPDKSSTGNNAVNQTTALSQSVTVDHSQLDKAVNDAKNAGLSVGQQPTTNQTVTEDKSDQAEAEIKNSYDQQTEQINKNTQEYLHDKNNYETYNNSEADHSNLDNAVNEAKKVPGLNVIHGETKVETAKAPDDTAIKNWKDKTTKDYEEQTKTVEEATAKQQAAYSEWLKNKQEQEAQYNPSKAIRTESAFVPAVVSYNNSTDVSSFLSGSGHQVGNEYGTWYDMYSDGKQTVKYTGLDYNSVVTARWKNAAMDPKTGQSLDFVINMTNFIKPAVSIGDMYVGVFKDLNSGICWDGTTAFKLTSGLYKSGTNELYDGYYISSQDSLDRQLPVDGQGGRAEFVSPKSGVIASFLPSDSKVMVDEQPVHGTAANMTPTAFYSSGIHSYADGPQAMIFLAKGLSSYVIGTTNPNGNDATNVNWGKEVIGAYFVQLGFGANSMKTVPMPTSEVQYYYNKLNIPVTSIIEREVKYQYHDLNVLSEPHKDVGSGEVSGTIKQSTDGKMVPKGAEITFSLTMPDMPAYRTDNISSRTTVDHLDPKFGYQKLKVWVQDSNGKLEDMTSHVKAELHGHDLYITEDNVLLARYNQDKSKKISIPVINLYGTALQDSSKIYNTYEVYTNDAKAVSNTVTVPTPDAPKPVKKDLNDQGVDINGKKLLSGEKPVFEIVADYDQYKGITANQVDIDKGFAIIDDYPDEAMVLEPGSATAFDVQNKPVTDLEYKIYNSIEEAPSNVQLAVARSGLTIKGAFLVASPKDNKEYFTKYVQTGNSVTVRLPGTIKKGYSGSLVNGGYEIDFGNGYATNVVTNPVSKIDPKKDVVLNVKDKASINKHIIKIGQNYNYELISSVRPANYGGNTKSWSISDTFDKRDHYNNQTLVQAKKDFVIDGHIVKTGEDITKYFNIKFDAATNKLTIVAKPEYVTALNSDINKAREQQFVAYVNVTRVDAGHVTNEFGETYNGVPVESNEVYTNTLNDPVKDWETDKNEVSTDKNFLVGEHAVGNVTADIPTKDMFTDGYKFEKYDIYDNYSDFAKKVTVGNSKVFVGEGKKAVDITNLFNIVNNSSKSVVTAQAKNPTDLLKYGGQKLHLLTDFKINNNAGEASKLTNDGGALVNDVEMKISKRPTITTFTNTPVKDVNLSEVNDPANKEQVVSINGRTVIDKTVVTFPLATKEALPANRATIITKEIRQDNLPAGMTYLGYKAFLKQADGSYKDVSDWYTVKLDGQTVFYTGNQALFDYYNADRSKETQRPVIELYASADKEATTYRNDYRLFTNDNQEVSNEVSIKTPKITPTKIVKNLEGQDINDKSLSRGDTVTYDMQWDLSDLSDLVLNKEDLAKGMSFYDDYDESKIDVQEDTFKVMDSKGNTINNDLSIVWDKQNGKVTVSAKDPKAFLDKYKGTKLHVLLQGTVKANTSGDIQNQGFQSTFGNLKGTNIVINHIPAMNPTKDVTVSVDDQTSLVNKDIELGQVFNYKLTSSVRPADYGGETNEWSGVDMLDIKHDQYTGQWQVRADYDFKLKDDTTIKKGDDISKYFTTNYDATSGRFEVHANKEYFDIMNLAENKATKQAWSLYIQVKRVAAGDVKNVWEESYNYQKVNSNNVETHTKEPEKPVTKPEPNTSTKIEQPVSNTAETPVLQQISTVQKAMIAPAKAVLPQTGEVSEKGEVLTGFTALPFALGSLGFAFRKKKTA